MALIQCGECNHDVSDKAANCPNCGNPISIAIPDTVSGQQITTTQLTSKKYKGHMLIGICLVIGGCTMFFDGVHESDSQFTITGTWAMLIGVIWYITARVKSWWNHG